MNPDIRDMVHDRVVQAPVDALYPLVADVSLWPVLLEPCVRARRIESDGNEERIEVWAQTNGAVTSWTSRRVLDPAGRSVAFRQERSTPPVASMSGRWSFRDEGNGRTRIVLTHSFSAVDGDWEALDWITAAVDRNSVRELAALGRIAEYGQPLAHLVLDFEDRVTLPGADAAGAYDFVHRSDLWPRRLPHVSRVDLQETPGGVQTMEMDTVTGDGSTHTTTSIRLCATGTRIDYKQTVLPALLSGHSGSWEFEDTDGGVTITSRHLVAIDPAAVERVLGPGATLEQAGVWVRDRLGANSRATMEAAGAYASSVVNG